MQKNAPNHYPENIIGRHEVPKEEGGTTVYPVVDSADGIAYYANLGAITFHVPPAKIDDELHPDWAVWDLDPPIGRVDLVRESASLLRSVLEAHEIPTAVLASGSSVSNARRRTRTYCGEKACHCWEFEGLVGWRQTRVKPVHTFSQPSEDTTFAVSALLRR